MVRLLFSALVVFATLAHAEEKVASPAAGIEESETRTKDEIEFLADESSPRMYSMEDAQMVKKVINRPILCWQGKNIFADPRARKLAMAMKGKVVMATMDSYKPYPDVDQFGPKILFDTSDYGASGRTIFIRVEDFKFLGDAGISEVSSTTENKVLQIVERYERNPKVKDWPTK